MNRLRFFEEGEFVRVVLRQMLLEFDFFGAIVCTGCASSRTQATVCLRGQNMLRLRALHVRPASAVSGYFHARGHSIDERVHHFATDCCIDLFISPCSFFFAVSVTHVW